MTDRNDKTNGVGNESQSDQLSDQSTPVGASNQGAACAASTVANQEIAQESQRRVSSRVSSRVIDLHERLQENHERPRFSNLKARLDAEQAKVAISAALMSILVVVTLLNDRVIGAKVAEVQKSDSQVATREIASISTGISDAEDGLAREIAKRHLSSASSVGRKPSLIEKLTFEQLEGKYSVRLKAGRISEIEFSQASQSGSEPKSVANLERFLDEQRALLPDDFHKSVRVQRAETNGVVSETYQLVNRISRPVATVEFKLDQEGRMIAMRVEQL